MLPNRKFFLNHLIDKYENSKLSTGDTTRNIKVSYHFNKKSIPAYFNETNYDFIEQTNQECLFLESKNFIAIHWRNEFMINRIDLNIDVIDSIYAYLKRDKKTNLEENIIEILLPYRDRQGIINKFACDMIDRLKEHKSIKSYLDIEKPDEVKELLKAIESVLKQESEILKRKFSITVFSNSKRFEQLENRVIKILRDYSEQDISDTEDLLAEYNILSNPSYVYLKGHGKFKCYDETIDLNKLKTDLAFNTNVINNLEVVSLDVSRVITIENLTTFYEYQPKDELVIYLGGYHNTVRRQFLKKIHQFNPKMSFYHWGDIDLGGFQILNHLRNLTGVAFKPLYMNLDILKKYEAYAMPIDGTYSNKLAHLLDKQEYCEFHPVIRYMIEQHIRLEQEIIND